jgi:hypothetical protein
MDLQSTENHGYNGVPELMIASVTRDLTREVLTPLPSEPTPTATGLVGGIR